MPTSHRVALVLRAALVLSCACSANDDSDDDADADSQAGTGAQAGSINHAGNGGSSSAGSNGSSGTNDSAGAGGQGGAVSSGGSGGNDNGGSGAAGSDPAAGAGGTEPLPDQPACAPATQSYPLTSNEWEPATEDCALLGFDPYPETQLANASGIEFADEIHLETPMQAGVPAAMSMALTYTFTEGTFEIWGGSGDACGAVNELLWWTEIQSRRFCAEFTPTQDTSRLVLVWREQEALNGEFDFGIHDIAICSQGECPGESGGHGLAPGVELTAPVGLYFASGLGGPYIAPIVWLLGEHQEGALVVRHGMEPQELDDPQPYSDGVMRLSKFDPFGDAWYCVGDGTNRIHMAETSTTEEITRFELRGLTRLASCEGDAGTGTANISIDTDETIYSDGVAQVTASSADLTMPDAELHYVCDHTRCALQFLDGTEESTLRSSQLLVELASDVGTWSTPTLVDAEITSGTWIYAPPKPSAMQVACVSGGSMHYDPAGETTLTITGITDTGSCPGEAIDPDSFDIQVQ